MPFSSFSSSSDQDQSYDNRLNKENFKSHAEFECSKSSIITTTTSANSIVQETPLMQESFDKLNQNVPDNCDSTLKSSYSFTASDKRDEARCVIKFAQKVQKKYIDSKHPNKQFGIIDLVLLKFKRFDLGYKPPHASAKASHSWSRRRKKSTTTVPSTSEKACCFSFDEQSQSPILQSIYQVLHMSWMQRLSQLKESAIRTSPCHD